MDAMDEDGKRGISYRILLTQGRKKRAIDGLTKGNKQERNQKIFR